MKNFTLIPLLVLSTACFKENNFGSLQQPEFSVSALNDRSFTLTELPTFHASFFPQNSHQQSIDLKSINQKELSRMSLRMAEKAFKNGRFDIVKALVLGTPALALGFEDLENLKEQLNSLLISDIKLEKDSGNIELNLRSSIKNLELEYYLVGENHITKIAETKVDSWSMGLSMMKAKSLNSDFVLKALSEGQLIVLMPKGLGLQYNFFTSDGEKFRAYQIAREMPLADALRRVDPEVVVRGINSIEMLFHKASSAHNFWSLIGTDTDKFLFYIQENNSEQDERDLVAESGINIGDLEYTYHITEALQQNNRLIFTFINIRRFYQTWNHGKYYAQELVGTFDHYNCSADRTEPKGWVETSVNNTEDLNFHLFFKEKEIVPYGKPIKIYQYKLGVKTNVLKKMMIEVPISAELEFSSGALSLRLADLKKGKISQYIVCLTTKYPQFTPESISYPDYNFAQYDFKVSIR